MSDQKVEKERRQKFTLIETVAEGLDITDFKAGSGTDNCSAAKKYDVGVDCECELRLDVRFF